MAGGRIQPVQRAPVARRGLTRLDAADYIGVTPGRFDKLVKEGKMPAPMSLGPRAVVWDVRALDVAFDRLGETGQTTTGNEWDEVLR